MFYVVIGVICWEGDVLDICKVFIIFYFCLRSFDGFYLIWFRYLVFIMRIDLIFIYVYRLCSIFKVFLCGYICIIFYMFRYDFEFYVLFYFFYYWCFLRFGICKYLLCLKLYMLIMYDILSDLFLLFRNL